MNLHTMIGTDVSIRKSLMSTVAALGLSASLPTAVHAQDESSDTADDGTEDVVQVASNETAEDRDEPIVVIGSRLRRTEFNSPDPLQIISPDLARKRGDTDAAELLQNSPLAAGSTQVTAALSSNFVTDGGFGAQTLSLRGLGATRTLVLLNGRRAGPAGTRGAVSSFDLNVLPLSVIEDVEVLKTGASSIYGSDAVAGVVNIKLRDSLDGFEGTAFASIPEESGGETYRASLAYGKTFDRGHFIVAGDYYRRKELTRGDRDYLACDEDYVFFEDGTRGDLQDPRTGEPVCFTNVLGNAIALFDFIELSSSILGVPTNSNLFSSGGFAISLIAPDDGQIGNFVESLTPPSDPFGFQFGAPSNFVPINYDGPSTGILSATQRELQDSVFGDQTRYTLFAAGEYDLTDNIEVFGEALYNKRQTYINATGQLGVFQYTSLNVALPLLFGDTNSLFTGDPFNVGFTGDVLILPVIQRELDFDVEVDYYRGVLGARGEFDGDGFFGGWNWEAYGQFSRSDGDYGNTVVFADSVASQEFRLGSCVGTTTSELGKDCIDINFTDPRVLRGDFNEQERDFLFGWEQGNTRYDQWIAEAFVSGPLFELPAGEVLIGIGGQFRRDEINDVPGDQTLAGNSDGLTGAGITAGHSETKELFGEIDIPLLRDKPFFQDLTINAAGRMTSVKSVRASDGFSDSDNGNWTYKLGANWQVNDWLRFRATYGTSFRSPALFEQFLADETGFLDQIDIDPCLRYDQRVADGSIPQRIADNCAADGVPGNYTGGGTGSAEIITGGGIGVLDPETSRAYTASVVLTPPSFWSGSDISFAVDYINILVKGQVAQLGAGNILVSCYNSEFFPDDPLCDQFDRVNDPANSRDNEITEVRDSFININRQFNESIDFTLRINQDLGQLGELSFLGLVSWQLQDEFGLFDDTVIDGSGEVGDPPWIGDFNLSWEKDNVTLLYGLRVIDGTSDREDVVDAVGEDLCANSRFRGGAVCADFKTGMATYHNLSATLEVAEKFEFTLGVSNLFDKKPERLSTLSTFGITGSGFIGQYPNLATYYDLLGRRFFANVRANF